MTDRENENVIKIRANKSTWKKILEEKKNLANSILINTNSSTFVATGEKDAKVFNFN